MHPTSPNYVKRQFSMYPCEDPRPISVTQKIYVTKLRFLPALLCGSWSLRVDMLERMKDHRKNKQMIQMIMIIIISVQTKRIRLHNIVIQSCRKKVQYIHSHIYSSASFHSDKVVSARDQEGGVDHGPSEAISAGQQGLGGSVLVPTYITPAFPNSAHNLDSIHLIIQGTILETLPFLLRVTRLSNANNRRPDMSSSLTSVVALPAGSCSLWIRIET